MAPNGIACNNLEYEAEKRSQGGKRDISHNENGQFTAKCHSDTLRSENTSQRIAREHNVSPSYVNRAAQFVRGLDIAEENVPGIRGKILFYDCPALRNEKRYLAEIVEGLLEVNGILRD